MASRPGAVIVEVFDIKVFCRRTKGFDYRNIRSFSSLMVIDLVAVILIYKKRYSHLM